MFYIQVNKIKIYSKVIQINLSLIMKINLFIQNNDIKSFEIKLWSRFNYELLLN